MEVYNEHELDDDLNINFEAYATTLAESYLDDSFTVYKVQSILEESPSATEVKEDFEMLLEEGILEKDPSVEGSKLPDLYSLNLKERTSSQPAPNETTLIEGDGETYQIERYDNILAGRGPNQSDQMPVASSEVARQRMANIRTNGTIPDQLDIS